MFWREENPLPLLGIGPWYLRRTACNTLCAEISKCRLQSAGCDTVCCFCLQHKNVPWRWKQRVFPTSNQTIQHQIWEGCSHTVQCCESLKYPNRLCWCCILLYIFSVLHPSLILLTSAPTSVVGIATGCGLDGRGIGSRWGRDFPRLSRPDLGPHPASCTMGTGSFWG
jgi:hypothetical protein